MVNMASGIARGRVLSLTTTGVVSHQYGDFSHASLVKHKVTNRGSHQLNGIEYSCQLTAVKTRNPLTSVTWPHRGLRCSLWECLLDDGVMQDWHPKKINRSTWVNLCMQLTSLQFDMRDPFHGQLELKSVRPQWQTDESVGSLVDLDQ